LFVATYDEEEPEKAAAEPTVARTTAAENFMMNDPIHNL
jgi:hypothetical protein